MDKDYAEIFGQRFMLDTTSAGHYVLPLLMRNNRSETNEDQVYNIEEVCAVNLLSADNKEKYQALDQLHKQFGHRPKKSFMLLLKNAESWDDGMSEILNKIIDSCEGCILRKRNPDRPAVAMPLATEFNDK